MTGMYEQAPPGIGHNQPDEYAEEKKHAKWERWAKKRTFVRAVLVGNSNSDILMV
jgi:hypothetical protein